MVEADESDGTFLELAPDAARRHQRRARPPRSLRRLRRARSTRSRRSSPASPGRARCCADDDVAADSRASRAATRRRASPTASPSPPTTACVDYAGDRGGTQFSFVASRATPLGLVQLPVPGPPQRAQRRRRGRDRARARRALRRGARARSAASPGVARRFEHRGERDGVTFVDDYAHLPGEVAAMIRAAARGRLGPGRRGVPAAPLHPHRGAVARLRRRVRRRRPVVLTDVYAAGEQPQPGVSGRLIVRAVLDAHPEQAVAYLPRRADLVGARAAPRPARRPRAHARRRRPHDRARRAGSAPRP